MKIKIYQIDAQGYFTGAVDEVEASAPAPQGWTRSEPPTVGDGEWAVFDGRWRIVDEGPQAIPQPVPTSITMRQARLQLHAIGKLSEVQEAINQLPEPPKTEAQIEWDYAAVVERASPFVALLTPALGLSDEQMDDLFREAAKL